MSLARNATLNVLAAGVSMGVTLVTVPLYLSAIGDGRFGVLAIVWTLFSYFGLVDLGIGRATAQRIAAHRNQPAANAGDVFWTSIAISCVLGFAGFFLLAAAVDALAGHIKFDDPSIEAELLDAAPVIAALLPVAVIGSVLSGALLGREEFKTIATISCVSAILMAVIPLFIALSISLRLDHLLTGSLIAMLVTASLQLWACHRKRLIGHPRPPNPNIARSLFGFGGWVTVSGIVSPILASFDRIFIGMISGAASVTYYAIPHSILARIQILPAALSQAAFPRFAAQGDGFANQMLAWKAINALAFLVTPIAVLLMLGIEPFLILWLGSEFADKASLVASILLLGTWTNALARIPSAMLQGQGRPDLNAKLHLMELPVYLVILYPLTVWFGIAGVAIAWSLRTTADALLLGYLANMSRTLIVHLIPPFGLLIVSMAVSALLPLDSPVRWAAAAVLIALTAWLTHVRLPDELRKRLAALTAAKIFLSRSKQENTA